jgi:hypothetical protein
MSAVSDSWVQSIKKNVRSQVSIVLFENLAPDQSLGCQSKGMLLYKNIWDLSVLTLVNFRYDISNSL